MMVRMLEDDLFPSTPGKVKIERTHGVSRKLQRCFASASTLFLWVLFVIALFASYLSFHSFVDTSSRYLSASWGDLHWERQIRASAAVRHPKGITVLVTGAAGFVGSHVSLALRHRGDGVVGLDNFNAYYDPSLKKARKVLLASHGVFVVEGDVNDAHLLAKLFNTVPFTHVMHLSVEAGVRYAIQNPALYVHSNVAGLVALLEASKSADPQPAIVWASSSVSLLCEPSSLLYPDDLLHSRRTIVVALSRRFAPQCPLARRFLEDNFGMKFLLTPES
ncbi:UDP-glucuronate 4-epimerase 1-like [Zingiber officinale]|uniref:UDP-glucuronate 4-epimerase 1-like n=1 Tax=Zingiber officinale TaxID=94328 RepID=UPI001C4BE8E8|nr:UDP-glucuronate 4-epimerase 1-like [Zingiber officinale]